MKRLSVLIGGLIFIGAITWGYFDYKKPIWERDIKAIVSEARNLPLKSDAWKALAKKSELTLPQFYPFSVISEGLNESAILLQEYEKRPEIKINTEKNIIPKDTIEAWHAYIDTMQSQLQKVFSKLQKVPEHYIPENQKLAFTKEKEKLQKLLSFSRDIDTIQRAMDRMFTKEESIMLLLQNQHEPRSTGGFSGSLVFFRFKPEGLAWEFSDVYAVDRNIPEIAQLPAPDFFHDLSKTISFRDANFWPDFPTSAKTYQSLLIESNQKAPETIMAINLNIIRDILEMTGEINLEPWYIKADKNNFDIVLQFLVESKIAGRFSTKAPVDYFASRLIKKILDIQDPEAVETKFRHWISNKDLMMYSRDQAVQKIINKFSLGGGMQPSRAADDFIHFDFVSIGANKSEKFVWSKIEHNSEITPEGLIRNTIKVKRTHAVTPGLIEQMLTISDLPPNIQALWSGDIPWKLGYSQNRTILRLWVPRGNKLVSQQTVSGPIKITTDDKMSDFQIWEVPLFVSPGETLETEIRYLTQLSKGNRNWRPYLFELIGTPGRDHKTKFLKTISTPQAADIEFLNDNTGQWSPLKDNEFRVDVRFD